MRLGASTPSKRAYRIKAGPRAFAVAFLASSIVVWGLLLQDEVFLRETPRWWVIGSGLAWLVVGVYFVAHMFAATVTLFEDAIECDGLFGTKRLRFCDIRGRRQVKVSDADGTTHYLRIEPNDPHLPTLAFMRDYDFDYDFRRWFESLSDLDSAS